MLVNFAFAVFFAVLGVVELKSDPGWAVAYFVLAMAFTGLGGYDIGKKVWDK